MKTVSVSVLLASSFLSASVAARPSFWSRARTPRSEASDAVIRAAHRTLGGGADDRDTLVLRLGFVDARRGAFITDEAFVQLVRVAAELGRALEGAELARLSDIAHAAPPSPVRALALLELGRILARKGDGHSAITCFGIAIGIGFAPEVDAEAYLRRGILRRRARELTLAGGDFDEVARGGLADGHVPRRHLELALLLRSLVLHEAGDLARARAFFDRALSVRRTSASASGLRVDAGFDLSSEERKALDGLEAAFAEPLDEASAP